MLLNFAEIMTSSFVATASASTLFHASSKGKRYLKAVFVKSTMKV